MKMTFKKELAMTSEERETIKKIMKILQSDDDLNSSDEIFDILIGIADGDYEALQDEYNYYIEIKS